MKGERRTHIAHMKEATNAYKILWGNLTGRDEFGEQDLH